MTARKLVIKTCGSCPYQDHRGAFGKIAYIPWCTKTSKNLPYKEVASKGQVHAALQPGIPDWCPLPENV